MKSSKSVPGTSLPAQSPSDTPGGPTQAVPALDILEMPAGPWFTPTDEDIRTAAYHLYLRSGHADDQALDHWLTAERQLRDQGEESPVPV